MYREGEGFFGEEMVSHISHYRTHIIGLDVADVDGDGKNEVLFIDNNTLYVCRLDGDRLVQIKKSSMGSKHQYLWLDAGDTDGDGKAEIYVSNTRGDGLDSFAMEWRNGELVPFAKRQNWFFRVMDDPEKGETLIGQRRKVAAGFQPGIYILKRQGNGFSNEEKLKLPKGANALNFAVGDITGMGDREIILFAFDDRLEIHGAGGDETWRSDDRYGGRPTSFSYQGHTAEVDQRYLFLPSRLILADTDGDGRNEVVVCKNEGEAGRWLAGMRFFTSGRIEFLKWQAAGMAPVMKTVKISRYISDYQIADADNDGEKELILSAVNDYSNMKGKANRSKIIIYELAGAKPRTQAQRTGF